MKNIVWIIQIEMYLFSIMKVNAIPSMEKRKIQDLNIINKKENFN